MYFGNPESYEWYAKRCLLYIRVSTEEQARHGYSLGAQLEELQAFSNQFCMKVAGIFTDEGVSARKEVQKRKGLRELLAAVERGETDYILFIKLDRWFRSVREYYRVQDILDAHNVGWKATLEDYDTATTNGRLNLNIRLSIAQDESDRTGDRIRFVNDSRVRNGGVISGSFPLALCPKDGRVYIDENKAEIVKALFRYYEKNGAVRPCVDYIRDNFGVRLGYNTIKRILCNPLYVGKYRDNNNYCPAIISITQFKAVQRMLSACTSTRERTHFYIFRGLIVCPECGRRMGGWAQNDPKTSKIYLRYRCNKRYTDKNCCNTFTPWEGKIEEYLLENIKEHIKAHLFSFESKKKQVATPKDEAAKIKRKIDRLKSLYIEELITIEDYRTDYLELTQQLANAKSFQKESVALPNQAALETIMDMDLKSIYPKLSLEEKRELWLSIIDKIIAINKNTFDIVFL